MGKMRMQQDIESFVKYGLISPYPLFAQKGVAKVLTSINICELKG